MRGLARSLSLSVKLSVFTAIFLLSFLTIAYSGAVTLEEFKDFTKPSISVKHEDDPRFETFGQKSLLNVSRDFGIPLEELIDGLALPQDIDPNTVLKELEEYGVSPRDVEAFIVEKGYDKSPVPSYLKPEEGDENSQITDSRFTGLGRKSLATISSEFNIPLEILIADLGLPEDIDPETQLRDLSEYNKSVPEINAYLEDYIQRQEGE